MIPSDVRKVSERVIRSLPNRALWPLEMMEAISIGILIERKRCEDICLAEREWEGELMPAYRRIKEGAEPLLIEGFNDAGEGLGYLNPED